MAKGGECRVRSCWAGLGLGFKILLHRRCEAVGKDSRCGGGRGLDGSGCDGEGQERGFVEVGRSVARQYRVTNTASSLHRVEQERASVGTSATVRWANRVDAWLNG